jgi:hypothetical protein
VLVSYKEVEREHWGVLVCNTVRWGRNWMVFVRIGKLEMPYFHSTIFDASTDLVFVLSVIVERSGKRVEKEIKILSEHISRKIWV